MTSMCVSVCRFEKRRRKKWNGWRPSRSSPLRVEPSGILVRAQSGSTSGWWYLEANTYICLDISLSGTLWGASWLHTSRWGGEFFTPSLIPQSKDSSSWARLTLPELPGWGFFVLVFYFHFFQVQNRLLFCVCPGPDWSVMFRLMEHWDTSSLWHVMRSFEGNPVGVMRKCAKVLHNCGVVGPQDWQTLLG